MNIHLIRKYFHCFLFIQLLIPLGYAQTIADIRFEGLKKSKQAHLERFVKSQIGEQIDKEQIAEDAQQLQNLLAVSRANYRLDSIKGKWILIFEVEEALSLFPILNFGGIRDNVWFQIGLKELNLAGKGQQLSVVYQNNDRRHNADIFYKIPYLGGSRWGASASFLRWASVEPLYFGDQGVFYNYNNTNINIGINREFQLNHNLEVGASYFVENYRKNERHANEITPGPEQARQPKALFKIVHQIRDISYSQLFLDGWDNVLNAQQIWNLDYQSVFHIVLNDTRYFKRLGNRINLAARMRLGISTNNDSPFAPFVLDSHVNIRGVGNRIDRGTAVAVLNLEYRQILFELDKIAFQVVGFSDIGTWREPGGELRDLFTSNSLIYFAGGGVRFIYKRAHNAVLRLDYGIDLFEGQGRGLVLGLGQYF